jgi:hypothetical protein
MDAVAAVGCTTSTSFFMLYVVLLEVPGIILKD